MNDRRRSLLAGLLAGLLLTLTGCGVFSAKEEPVPEEYQQTAVVEFEQQ